MKKQIIFEFDTDEQAERFERWFENRGEDLYHEHCQLHALPPLFFHAGRRYSCGGDDGTRVFKTYPESGHEFEEARCTLLKLGSCSCDDCRFP